MLMGLNESQYPTVKGKSVWNHIIMITPEEDDIPWGFKDKIITRNFQPIDNFPVSSLLSTDPDFKAYYDSNEERYHDPNPDDLNHEIVVVDGELLDGYSRAANLIRNNVCVPGLYVLLCVKLLPRCLPASSKEYISFILFNCSFNFSIYIIELRVN